MYGCETRSVTLRDEHRMRLLGRIGCWRRYLDLRGTREEENGEEYITEHCDIAHLRQQCHNSKLFIVQEKHLKVLKCYNFPWVQRRHNWSLAASFANCVMLKVRLQTFLPVPITQKCQILRCDTLVANERHVPLAIYFSGYQIEKNEIGWTCSTCGGGEERCLQHFGGENWGEETTWKIQAWMGI